jgi:hypothetical protein
MQKFRQICSRVSPLVWLYLLSLPLAILLFFAWNTHWGAIDEGVGFYEDAMVSWKEVFSKLFIPQDPRISFFGYFRPLPVNFYLKFLRSVLGLEPLGINVLDWCLSWVNSLAFAWGFVQLLRKAFPLAKEAVWGIAILVWWTPTWVFCTTYINPDCWMQPGLIGLMWGFWYSSPELLPRWVRTPVLRYGLGILFGFLSCQSYESAVLMLCWTSLFLTLARWMKLDICSGRRLTILELLGPAVLGFAYVLVFRSLDPASTNRTEIVTSYQMADLLSVSRFYLAMAFYGVSEPVMTLLGLSAINSTGQDIAETPIAFCLCLAGLIIAIYGSRSKAKGWASSQGLSWILMIGAALLAVPYLPMQNRALFYYGLRMNIFVSVFIGLRLFWSESVNRRFLAWGMTLYVGGMMFASYTMVWEGNWLKKYGGISLRFYEKVIALPETKSCTSDSPCCLNIVPEGWLYNYTTVNWNDGGPLRPRFVKPGNPCDRTINVSGRTSY